jgi:hypothetical protein
MRATLVLFGLRLVVVAAYDPWHGQGCVLTPDDMQGPYFQVGG